MPETCITLRESCITLPSRTIDTTHSAYIDFFLFIVYRSFFPSSKVDIGCGLFLIVYYLFFIFYYRQLM
jgi:hypothetical protein